VYDVLVGLPDVSHAVAEPPMRALVESLGLSPNQVFGILRVAVTGQMVSPPLFESMEILPRATVLERVKNAIAILENA
jgi:glutamyl-tRNA synthetase